MTGHIPIDVAIELEPMISLLDEMISDLLDTNANVCVALARAQYSLKDAINRDELGLSDWFAPEWANEAAAMSPYVRAAIQSELAKLAETPREGARRAIHKTARSIGRWAGGGCIDHDDAKQAIWKVVAAMGFAQDMGEATTIEVLRTGWQQGLANPRQAPATLEAFNG